MTKKRAINTVSDRGMWSSIGTAAYEINGRRYTFDIRKAENAAHFAWCKTVNKWAWLYFDRVLFENDGAYLAKRIKFELKNGQMPTL